jgi:hypothetical protein
MTTEQADSQLEWRVEATEGKDHRPEAVLIGPGHHFILHRHTDAAALAEILNAQLAALTEAAQQTRRYDCGKTNLQKAAMVPCLNLPKLEECYACQITKARYDRNSYCICDDDDELPTGPADYCPVHGNTYKYVLQEEARLVDTQRARDAARERAERLVEALQRIAAMTGETGLACSEVAKAALG